MSQAKATTGNASELPPVVITQHRPKAVLAASAGIDKFYADEAARLAAPPVEPPVTLQSDIPPVEPPAGDPPPAPPAPPAPPPPDPNDFEHRLRSEQGRTRAATRRAEVAEAQLFELTQRITALETARAEPAAAPPGPLADLTPEEIESLGPEMLGIINRRAQIIARGEVARLEAQVQGLQNGIERMNTSRVAQTREEMFAEMDTALPNWRQINVDDRFLEWLDKTDLMSGQKRKSLLIDAFNKNNAERVIAFFKTFVNNDATPGNALPQAAQHGPPKLPLEALAAPGRGPSSTVPASPDKPVWTAAGIDQFYSDVRRGKFKGREQEQNALEADLMLAQAEGRVKTS